MLLFNLLPIVLIITFFSYKKVPSYVGLVVNTFDDANTQRGREMWASGSSRPHTCECTYSVPGQLEL